MNPAVERALDALRSEHGPWAQRIPDLSDLDPQAAAEAGAAWSDLPAGRRRESIQLCGELANRHIELNFDWLSRLALTDPDPGVRRTAVANLWECDDPGLPGALLDLLDADPDLDVRIEAAAALGRFVYQAEVTDVAPERRRGLEAGLLSAAEAAERRLALRALESLGHSSHPRVATLIAQAYDAGDEASRQAALLAMGRSGDRRWAQIVQVGMRHPSPQLRREAARAAGELELRQSVPDLLELLEDAHPEVQRNAIWSLGQIGGRRAARALERLAMGTDDVSLAEAAQEALELLVFLDETRHLEAGLRRMSDET